MNRNNGRPTPNGTQPSKPVARDFVSSFVVFLVALPLCMGIAIASGTPPALGLISGIIGGLVVGIFAGSPLQVSGPAAGLAVLVWEITRDYGLPALGVAVMAAGILQVVAGFANLGRWFRAVSPALIQGMLAGIGVLILGSQFHVMLDTAPAESGLANLLTIPGSAWDALVLSGDTSRRMASSVGISTIGSMLLWNKFRPAICKTVPGPLIGVFVGTLLANITGMSIAFVGVPDSLLDALNTPSVSSFSLLMEPAFLAATLGLGLIASAETLLCATATDRLSRRSRTDYDRELIAQGIGNGLAGLVGALPVAGVIVRSSANVDAGATTRWSAVGHGGWLLVVGVALPMVLSWIPSSSLAAILVYIGYKLASPAQVKTQWQTGRGEALVFLITVGGVVVGGLLLGVLLGLGTAAIKLLVSLARLDIEVEESDDEIAVALSGAATFVSLPTLASQLENLPNGRAVVLHIGGLTYIDHACMELLREWQGGYEAQQGRAQIAWDDLRLCNGARRESSDPDRARSVTL
jgi:MFS superfamily sulfate permease-like transporter